VGVVKSDGIGENMEIARAKPGSEVASDQQGWGIRRTASVAGYVGKAVSLLVVCILMGLLGPSARGAQNDKNKLEFLVARGQIHDPFFQHSVVVMLPSVKSPLVVGLIVNKPTRMTISNLFPKSPEFNNRTEYAYFGGPVNVAVASLVFRSPTAPEHAFHVYGDAYLTFDSTLISTVFQNSEPASRVRLFLGRAQWAPAQLRNEIQQGAWYKVEAEGDLIFSASPQSLWRTLHTRAAPSKYIKYRLPETSPKVSQHKSAVM